MFNCHAVALGVLAAATPAAAGEIAVTMSGAAYAPITISARAGDVLRFFSDDGTDHNVFVPTASHAVDLGKQEPGAASALVLRASGRFVVECVIHPDLVAAVEVRP